MSHIDDALRYGTGFLGGAFGGSASALAQSQQRQRNELLNKQIEQMLGVPPSAVSAIPKDFMPMPDPAGQKGYSGGKTVSPEEYLKGYDTGDSVSKSAFIWHDEADKKCCEESPKQNQEKGEVQCSVATRKLRDSRSESKNSKNGLQIATRELGK